ncbi:Nucleoporin nup45 [Taphrina deformans PYCC 5710]|uniref:Nucleoporin nup45 n=1 Tax=Taphrina deformans (strain PYCC 5710 / ATCC 11124 / CBS 356.35 / IMI 108563 / JCM 9778 / NBRC 8474) TaxID=1097556 RepID=R4X7R9_TAPDE|nr:Nucleoporin nup45 [Taphrina deformans PYCC 5710]|eukprot:CCG81228.1 Nucleoporin nup45 [Taphrina deformans PYCC 5710]
MFNFGNSSVNNNSNNNNNNNSNPNNNQQTSFSGFSSLQPQQQQQQQQQQQSQFQLQQSTNQNQNNGNIPIERLTRVSDLPNDAQNLIEQLNQHIIQQISISDQFALNEESLGQTVESVTTDVAEIQKREARTQAALQLDQSSLETLRDQVHGDAEDVRISTRFVDGIKTGTLNLRGSTDLILKYFFDVTNTIEGDIKAYDKLISSIERHVINAKGNSQLQDSETLIAALKSQHESFMRVASKVATAHDRVNQVTQQ